MLLDTLFKRGQTYHCGGRNSVGAKIPRHSTKCATKELALKYVKSIDDLTLAQWKQRNEAEKTQEKERSLKQLVERPERPMKSLIEAMDEWLLKNYRDAEQNEGAVTKDQYRIRMTACLIEPLAKLNPPVIYLGDVTSEHLFNLQQSWLAKGLKVNTIKTYRASLAAMFNWFVRYQGLPKNPWNAVAQIHEIKPTLNQILDRRGTDKGIATLPLDLDGDANWRKIQASIIPFCLASRAVWRPLLMRPESFLAYLELLYYTGLRRSDACVFRPDWIKPSANGASYCTTQRKTGGGVTVFLSQELADKLRRLPRLPWRGKPGTPGAGLYPFWDGSCRNLHLYMNSNIGSPLSALGRSLGIKGLRPHRFRDSFAVNCLNSGLRIEDLSRLLGHTDYRTTQRYYAPFVPSRERWLEQRASAARTLANWDEADIAQGAPTMVH